MNNLRKAEILANLLDSQFRVFGIKFGIDPLISLVPGLGGGIGVLLSLYIVWLAVQMEIPIEAVIRMLLNIAIDFLISLIPGIGIVGDVLFRSNRLNIEILRKYQKNIFEGEIVG